MLEKETETVTEREEPQTTAMSSSDSLRTQSEKKLHRGKEKLDRNQVT